MTRILAIFVLCLIVGAVMMLIFAVGVKTGRRQVSERLTRTERDELRNLRQLKHELSIRAVDSAYIGEVFPSIVLDELAKSQQIDRRSHD